MELLILKYLLVALLGIELCAAGHAKRAVPLGHSLTRRNAGGQIKDWYLGKFTKNYFCTDTGRLIPVDPETGHMLLRGLRKRDLGKREAGGWIDDALGHDHKTEKGGCWNPTWVLIPGWTQPIPVTQLLAQYPWLVVDQRGRIHLEPEYREWLEQQAAARQNAGVNPAFEGAGGAGRAATVTQGGVGFVPPSALNVGAGTGFGGNIGNGLQAGTAAHI